MTIAQAEWQLGGASVSVLVASPAVSGAVDAREEAARRTVILLHGLKASRETMRPEMERLAALGFRVLAPDAPHHGGRDDGWLATMLPAPPPERHRLWLDLLEAWVREVRDLTAAVRAEGDRVATVGVSMGGFTVLAAARGAGRPDACVPLIASPDWAARLNRRPAIGEPAPASGPAGADGAAVEVIPTDPREEGSPARHPDDFAPMPLLAVTAGRDTVVPPGPMREFIARLRSRYGEGDRLALLDYPESEHIMRPEDWSAAWEAIGTWLRRYL